MSLISEFFSGFWTYISQLTWFEGITTIFVVLVTFFIGKYWRTVIGKIGEKILGSSKTDMLQYRMFWGLVRDVIQIQIKDECRRAMNENNFAEMVGNEYILYVKDKSKLLMYLIKQHIVNLYPSNVKMRVELDQITNFLNAWQPEFESVIFEIFNEAKKIKRHNVEQLRKLDADFVADVEKHIATNKGSDSCTECLMMIFGKREIVETRKKQIQTIKTQMNVVEHKLIEIQSKLLTFYGDQLNKKSK